MFFATVPPQWCFLRQWSVYFATVAGDNSTGSGSQHSRGGGKGVKEDEESRREGEGAVSMAERSDGREA